jgi:hypothetical protein
MNYKFVLKNITQGILMYSNSFYNKKIAKMPSRASLSAFFTLKHRAAILSIMNQDTANMPHSPGLEELEGLIERVTFHSPESGFCVLRVKVRGNRDPVTVVGTLPQVQAGEWIRAQGLWIIDREHGQQFKAQILHTTAPTTLEGK